MFIYWKVTYASNRSSTLVHIIHLKLTREGGASWAGAHWLLSVLVTFRWELASWMFFWIVKVGVHYLWSGCALAIGHHYTKALSDFNVGGTHWVKTLKIACKGHRSVWAWFHIYPSPEQIMLVKGSWTLKIINFVFIASLENG